MLGYESTPCDDDFADEHKGGKEERICTTMGITGHNSFIWTYRAWEIIYDHEFMHVISSSSISLWGDMLYIS
jgi:hypothetical protein